ncbi:TPA: hypothetical protein U1V52_000850 [Streptococcus suis]|nr:hypothetical protein [Streptococcus suis]
MHRTVGILEFKEFMAFEDGQAVPVYLHSANPTVPTTNKDDTMRVTKCRYKKEFADKYIFRKVEAVSDDQ